MSVSPLLKRRLPEVRPMSLTRKQIEAEARRLPPEERVLLAEALILSLDDEAEVERAWATEVRRRLEQLDNGEVETIPADKVLAELEELLE